MHAKLWQFAIRAMHWIERVQTDLSTGCVTAHGNLQVSPGLVMTGQIRCIACVWRHQCMQRPPRL